MCLYHIINKYLAVYICYRQTRKYMQRVIKPGIKLIDMCETLEETARTLVEANGLTAGAQLADLASVPSSLSLIFSSLYELDQVKNLHT